MSESIHTNLAALRASGGPGGLHLAQRLGLARMSLLQFERGALPDVKIRRLFEWAWYWEASIADVVTRPRVMSTRRRTGWPPFYRAGRAGDVDASVRAAHNARVDRAVRAVLLATIDARQRAGMSQVDLARAIGLNQANISRAENGGSRSLTLQYVDRVATACGLTVSSILLAPAVLAAERAYLTEFHSVADPLPRASARAAS